MRAVRPSGRKHTALLVALLALATSACNSAPTARAAKAATAAPTPSSTTIPTSTTAASSPQTSLVIEARPERQLTDNFNPFDSAAPLTGMGVTSYIYEPLLQYSEMQIDQYYPWLASSWSFSSSGLTITFNLRPKVTWANGSAFTAADVVYTFNLLRANPGIDEGLPIVSAEADGPGTFVLTLSHPGYAYLYNIAHVPIVKAGYASGVPPRTYVDRNPDGTGPYELAAPRDFTPRQVVLTARTHYWQGAPPFSRLVFPAFPDRSSVVAALEQGSLDWAGEELGADAAAYLARDKVHNHSWAPPVGTLALELNLLEPSFDDRSVRQAISDAIDRAALSTQLGGDAGAAVSSLSGLVLPDDNEFLLPSDTGDAPKRPELKVVAALMASAGYQMSPQGYWTSPTGKRLQVDIEDPAGSALASAATVVAEQLNAAGFYASASAPPAPKWRRDLVDGDFVASILPSASGPSPYYTFEQWLDPTLVVGGQAPRGNYERFGTRTVPGAAAAASTQLARFAESLSGSLSAMAAERALGALVASQLPVIPLVYNVAWGEFSTRHATGWPGPNDPYEPGSPRGAFAEYTLLQLSPVSTP